MPKLDTFEMPEYPEEFLKTKLGKRCIFYSILPYLCCDKGSNEQNKANKKFLKCKAFCSQEKIKFISEHIYKNRHKDNNTFSDSLLKREEKNMLLYGIRFRVLTAGDNEKLSMYEKALKSELEYFPENDQYLGYNKRDIYLDLIKRSESFVKIFLIAKSCHQLIKRDGKYSLLKAVELDTNNANQNIDEAGRYCGTNSVGLTYYSMLDFSKNNSLLPLMPLIYSLMLSMMIKENLKIAYLKKKTKKSNIDDVIKISTDEEGISLKSFDEFYKKNVNADFIFSNRCIFVDSMHDIITCTNQIADDLVLKSKRKISTPVYYKFKIH